MQPSRLGTVFFFRNQRLAYKLVDISGWVRLVKIPESTLQGHVPSRQRNSLSTGSLQSDPDPGHTAWPASTLHQGCQPQGQGQHLGSHGETQCSTGLAATAVFCFCVVLLGSSTDCSRYGQCQCHNVNGQLDI